MIPRSHETCEFFKFNLTGRACNLSRKEERNREGGRERGGGEKERWRDARESMPVRRKNIPAFEVPRTRFFLLRPTLHPL